MCVCVCVCAYLSNFKTVLSQTMATEDGTEYFGDIRDDDDDQCDDDHDQREHND